MVNHTNNRRWYTKIYRTDYRKYTVAKQKWGVQWGDKVSALGIAHSSTKQPNVKHISYI